MKLAIVDPVGNPGGGSRYLRALVPHLLELRPDLKITFFGNSISIDREQLRAEWKEVEIKNLSSLWLSNRSFWDIPGAKQAVKLFQQRICSPLTWIPYFFSGSVHKELESKIKGFDLAFFPWPFFLTFPKLSCPSVAVFHDFNFKYYFSGQGFSPHNLDTLDREIPVWLKNCLPVVSTYFVRSELEKFYPDAVTKTKVIHLGPMGSLAPLDRSAARQFLDRKGLPAEYILYPTNISPHKNLGPLYSAMYLLRQKGWKIPLILAGYGTENLNGRAHPLGMIRDLEVKEIVGLGYVSNEEIDALIQYARIVINTSLYEAGNGSGLDAWGKGVPVAMSDIPAFREHVEVQGVKAKLFDPRSPQSIADQLESILKDPEAAERDAKASLDAISNWSWKRAAGLYLQTFEEALGKHV